jgi:hypothetical protein
MSAEEQIEKLTKRLDEIADANGDEFSYSIEIETGRRAGYRFKAVENADKHEFVSGHGNTLEDAVTNASEGLESACESWGYDLPKG